MMAVQETDKTGPTFTPDQLVAAAVVGLVSPHGRGLGPTPKRVAEARRGAGRPTITVSARLFIEALDVLEAAHPGLYENYLTATKAAE